MSNSPHEQVSDEASQRDAQADAANCPTGCRVVPPQLTARPNRPDVPIENDPIEKRADSARDLRIERANVLRSQPLPSGQLCNGEEEDYQKDGVFIAMYSKGLSHDSTTGEVTREAYCALLRGLKQ